MVYRKNMFVPFLYEHEVVSHTVLFTLDELSFLFCMLSDAEELPIRKHTTFRTRRKFEIKNNAFLYFHKWNILYVPNTDIKNLCSLSTE
jgi:hypothetical protein